MTANLHNTLPPAEWPDAQALLLAATGVMEDVVLTAESEGGLSIMGWDVSDAMIDDSDPETPVLVVQMTVRWGG